jgi:hypothetical protein
LKILLQSLSFEILFFSSQKQTDFDQFSTFFEKKSRIYKENSQAKPKNITLVSIDTCQVAKHDQAEFQPATQKKTSRKLLIKFRKSQILSTFSFQSFSGKLLNTFHKIPNLSIHFYFSISNAF